MATYSHFSIPLELYSLRSAPDTIIDPAEGWLCNVGAWRNPCILLRPLGEMSCKGNVTVPALVQTSRGRVCWEIHEVAVTKFSMDTLFL